MDLKNKFHNLNFFKRIKNWIISNKKKSVIGFIILIIYYFSLPRTLFAEPYSTVIESSTGELLGAKIASDGQWRFPEQDSIPDKFKQCVVYFEDEHFYHHFGFNPVAMVKAVKQNKTAGKVVRGGSTVTQQVIRLARKNKKRTYFEKIIEIILATRLEFRYSKQRILELYAAHAPFGGNVVGLEMAAWRYFGVQPHQLSWAESATLAVLPNAPRLIYPGKNQQLLLRKRNRLLKKLLDNKVIDQMTYDLALTESLPQKPYDLPQIAPHLLQKVAKENSQQKIVTTIDVSLQNRVNQIVRQYYSQYSQNEVHNMAVIILDVRNRNILSYVGNTPTDANHDKDVDIITAPRSTGSILKPLLFASMLDDGELLSNTLVPDIPTQISGYIPQNYNLTFDGAVPAQRALSRSLNIPAVLMLQEHGVHKFYETLKQYKLKNINKHPDHYGLSLILGGAESNLWDLSRTYANLTSTLNYYNEFKQYRKYEFSELNYKKDFQPNFGTEQDQKEVVGAGAIYLTYEAMKEVNRPAEDEAWRFYDSSIQLAWKTGTSFGNRDAWAIGTNSDYVVGVWVGNASGEGRPQLTGIDSAAPVLFDVFNLLPRKKWFKPPISDLVEKECCAQSGYLAKTGCPKVKQMIPKNGTKTIICPFHKTIHLDITKQFQVNNTCEDVDKIVTQSWFILPPVMEWYYKGLHIDYKPLPPYRQDCQGASQGTMGFIYPKANSKIYLTKNFQGKIQPVIFKIAHSNRESKLYWYIDKEFEGTTQTFHEMPIITSTGRHLITVVDEKGMELKQYVTIENE
ncbi:MULTISPECIES: penicillin-binding protein 1C [Flavobacterium]|uniref:peptidoglycan glycosyltransferase n=1 Tax=Flavobacterium covae TaxID=2906076 RepID=A0ABW8PCN9_9FLAO|nr:MULTISPECIES: penicillin-binding protein 1C [Flavobacterium]AMA49965.1 penicillin-binding protein 1C [Flavobacterium covae]MCJ1807240.1 penicillin-binding protein 1C [Flavobacterium covae]MCJ1808585.1 penicillin-binding protein 1C [Flavobacterium covae]OWP81583.1 penicillin-binding protein 1C [Flavobacterium covae]POR22983.1 penicillin-binding protein 1C [Flavobacterium columnare]